MPDTPISKECRAEIKQRFNEAEAANPQDGILGMLSKAFVGSNGNTDGFRQLRYDAAMGDSKCREGEVPNIATFASVTNELTNGSGGRGGGR